jgi:hypothetical protein
MDDTTPNNRREAAKRPYIKPQIQEVPLRPDEAVLGNCKTASIGGPSAMGNCTMPSACSAVAS